MTSGGISWGFIPGHAEQTWTEAPTAPVPRDNLLALVVMQAHAAGCFPAPAIYALGEELPECWATLTALHHCPCI